MSDMPQLKPTFAPSATLVKPMTSVVPGGRRPTISNQASDCWHKRKHTLRAADVRVRPHRRADQIGRTPAGKRHLRIRLLLLQPARGSLQSRLQAGHRRPASAQTVPASGGMPEGVGSASLLHRVPRPAQGGGEVSGEARRGAPERRWNVRPYPF